jgi:hypothetical protein
MGFRLKCKIDLFNNLGKYDAIVEVNEIALKDFLTKAIASNNVDDYIKAKSQEYGVKVDSVDLNEIRTRVSYGYILSVYQSFELFLRTFKDEYCELYNVENWNLPNTNENLLLKIIKKVSNLSKAKRIISESKIELFDYYRIVRNKYVHAYIESSKVERAFIRINEHNEILNNQYPGLNAPNRFDEISFDDFILFTRVVKDIAIGLCKIIEPNSIDVYSNYYIGSNLFSNRNTNLDRKSKAIKADLKFRFGITKKSEEIVNAIMSQ